MNQRGVFYAECYMTMQFINFGNQPTYHVFRWVAEGGYLDVNRLIAAAYDKAAGDEWFQLGVGPAEVARGRLAEDLRDLVDDLHAGEFGGPFTEPERGIGDVSADTHSLFAPLLSEALGQVDWLVVAQAVLMRANKWAPEKEIPEA